MECLTVFTCFYSIYIYTWRVHVNDFNAPCMTELCFDLALKKVVVFGLNCLSILQAESQTFLCQDDHQKVSLEDMVLLQIWF